MQALAPASRRSQGAEAASSCGEGAPSLALTSLPSSVLVEARSAPPPSSDDGSQPKACSSLIVFTGVLGDSPLGTGAQPGETLRLHRAAEVMKAAVEPPGAGVSSGRRGRVITHA